MSTLTITRIAHSSVLIDIDGHAILTDPWYSERPGYYHGEPYGIALADLPRLDGVTVSHDHYDHYDLESFAAYPHKDVPFAVKRGLPAPGWPCEQHKLALGNNEIECAQYRFSRSRIGEGHSVYGYIRHLSPSLVSPLH